VRRTPIPGIDPGHETPAQKAAQEAAVKAASAAQQKALTEARIASARQAIEASDVILQLLGDELRETIRTIAKRRGRKDPALVSAKVIRAYTGPTPDLQAKLATLSPELRAQFEATPPPFTIARAPADLALAIGLCDSLVMLAPQLPILAEPWFPPVLTSVLALTMILRSAPDPAPVVRVVPKTEDARIKVEPVADAPEKL
jgi:hypothetical protein